MTLTYIPSALPSLHRSTLDPTNELKPRQLLRRVATLRPLHSCIPRTEARVCACVWVLGCVRACGCCWRLHACVRSGVYMRARALASACMRALWRLHACAHSGVCVHVHALASTCMHTRARTLGLGIPGRHRRERAHTFLSLLQTEHCEGQRL